MRKALVFCVIVAGLSAAAFVALSCPLIAQTVTCTTTCSPFTNTCTTTCW